MSTGFNVWVLLFGALWYLSKGMSSHAFKSALISIVTCGGAWVLYYPFVANKHYVEFLLEKGYTREGHVSEERKILQSLVSKQDTKPQSSSDTFDQIEKLSQLYKEGILTEEEFQRKKTELLES